MPDRIQLRRIPGWRLPPGAIVVSRPSRWGNPYRVGDGQVTYSGRMDGPGAGFYDPRDSRMANVPIHDGLTAVEAVSLYRADLEANLADPDPFYDELRAALEGLRGHDLACWCGLEDPCHGDPLLELANR